MIHPPIAIASSVADFILLSPLRPARPSTFFNLIAPKFQPWRTYIRLASSAFESYTTRSAPSLAAPMAIFNAVPPPGELTPGQTPSAQAPPIQGPIDLDAWTASALQSLSVSPVARGTGTPLAIRIDQNPSPKREKPAVTLPDAETPEAPCRPPSRRDSQRRRDALLKGNEGSRQRRRWENGTPLS